MSSGEQEQHLLGIDFGNGTNYERFPKPVISPLLDAVNTIIACLAVLGNGMVITVMLLRRRVFSSFTNRLILHQSIIDAIAVIMFFLHHVVIKSPHVSVSMKENINDHLVCRFVYSDFALWCVNVTSTYNHVVISLERFMATCYPVKHRNTLTKTKFKIVVPAVWIVGIIDNVPLLFVNEPHLGCCQMASLQSGWLYVLYTFPITVEYLVPVTVMIFTYTRILIMLTKKLADPGNAALNVINKAKKGSHKNYPDNRHHVSLVLDTHPDLLLSKLDGS
ncbi:cholecystokinin receptor type A-like [Patiria miniata]|uniref:G-protein coupled receptors family 1 profile domain-containing protein n=1 Tax=Patiria miniata TaxID=46514 RepID=A0A914AZW7_PATMI|nr:cholecystokinin receptor type A-like [Patiria miniata]